MEKLKKEGLLRSYLIPGTSVGSKAYSSGQDWPVLCSYILVEEQGKKSI